MNTRVWRLWEDWLLWSRCLFPSNAPSIHGLSGIYWSLVSNVGLGSSCNPLRPSTSSRTIVALYYICMRAHDGRYRHGMTLSVWGFREGGGSRVPGSLQVGVWAKNFRLARTSILVWSVSTKNYSVISDWNLWHCARLCCHCAYLWDCMRVYFVDYTWWDWEQRFLVQ